MSSNDRFATAITCIDGRVQRPVSDWVKLRANVDHVDLITEPGPEMVLTTGPALTIDELMRKVAFSVRHHFSPLVVLAGHHDCAANRISKPEQVEQIMKGVEVILSYHLKVRVMGLWLNEFGSVDLLWDSETDQD